MTKKFKQVNFSAKLRAKQSVRMATSDKPSRQETNSYPTTKPSIYYQPTICDTLTYVLPDDINNLNGDIL